MKSNILHTAIAALLVAAAPACAGDSVEQTVNFSVTAINEISVSTASVIQQCLGAGLLDELHIDLVPVVLGAGIRLFEQLGAEPLPLD